MTLLAPLTAILAGAVALPALLALYFLKLRRRPVRVSSTMLWEQAVHDLQVNAPFRMIRPSWLLLLHLVILALLLLALARPAISGGGPAGSVVYLLVDRSASMSATDMPSETTRLDAAKARAIELAESMARGGQSPEFTVVAFAAEAVVVAPPSQRPAAVRAAINSIEPTDQAGDPYAALALVESLASGMVDETSGARPVAVLLSDGGDADEPLISLATDLAFEPIAPAVVPGGSPDARAPDAGANDDVGNTGIIAVNAVRDFDDPGRVRLFVRLTNTAPTRASVLVTVLRGEDQLARAAVTVPAASGTAASPSVGETARTIELRDLAGGPITVSIGRDDTLDADDTAWLVLSPPAVPAVLLVAPPDATGEAAPDPFLVDLLGALRTRSVRTVSADRYAGFGSNDLRDFDLVILDRVTPPRDPPIASLSFGATLPSLLDGRTEPTQRAATGGDAAFVNWDRTHPVMQDLALDAVQIGRWVELPADGIGPVSVRVLASGSSGPLMIQADDNGVLRLIVAYPLSASNWVVDVSFAIFMATAIEHLTAGDGDRAVWFTTAEPAIARGLRTDGTVRVESIVGGPIARDLPVRTAGSEISLGVLERAGLYSVSGGATASRLVAVNLADPGESSLRVRPR
ncbi:MAG: VWA domain-containing protein, partial [Planctomycetota bacterium]